MPTAAIDPPEVSSSIPRLNLFRGLRAAVLLGIVGAAATVLIALCYMVVGWFVFETIAIDRSYDLQHFWSRYNMAILGISLLFTATGWATYAPRGEYRFIINLGILGVISSVLWILIATVRNAVAPWYKVERETSLQVFFDVLAYAVPLLVGLLLSIVRCVRLRGK
jgi:hypothetical protein